MKKVFKFFLILLSGFFLALVIIAVTVRDVTFETTIEVGANIEDTWATLMDTTRWDEWMPDIERVEVVNNEHIKIHATNGGIFEEKLTSVVEHERVTADVSSSSPGGSLMATGNYVTALEDRGDSVLITQTMTSAGANYLWRAFIPVMKPIMVSQQKQVLEQLANLIETNPSEIPPAETIISVPDDTTSATAPTDSVTVPADSVTVPTDSVTVPTDSATVPTDSVTVPTDSATVPTDSVTVPTEEDPDTSSVEADTLSI